MKIALAALALVGLVGSAQAQSIKDHGSTVNWTGPYAGAHIGYGWLDGEQRQTNGGMTPGPFKIDGEGVFGGGTIGYNYQTGQFVVGIEAEGGYLDIGGNGKVPSVDPTKVQNIDVDSGLYGLVAARAGFAWDRTLFYGKGGYAITDIDVGQKTTKPGFTTQCSDSLQGFVYGAGIEQQISDKISLKLEWLRFDFDAVTGSQTSVTDIPIGFVYTNKTDLDPVDTLKLGVNVRF